MAESKPEIFIGRFYLDRSGELLTKVLGLCKQPMEYNYVTMVRYSTTHAATNQSDEWVLNIDEFVEHYTLCPVGANCVSIAGRWVIASIDQNSEVEISFKKNGEFTHHLLNTLVPTSKVSDSSYFNRWSNKTTDEWWGMIREAALAKPIVSLPKHAGKTLTSRLYEDVKTQFGEHWPLTPTLLNVPTKPIGFHKVCFRPHRGGLAESLAEEIEIEATKQAILKHINSTWVGLPFVDLTTEYQGVDSRLSRKSFIVLGRMEGSNHFFPVGYSSGQIWNNPIPTPESPKLSKMQLVAAGIISPVVEIKFKTP